MLLLYALQVVWRHMRYNKSVRLRRPLSHARASVHTRAVLSAASLDMPTARTLAAGYNYSHPSTVIFFKAEERTLLLPTRQQLWERESHDCKRSTEMGSTGECASDVGCRKTLLIGPCGRPSLFLLKKMNGSSDSVARTPRETEFTSKRRARRPAA
jgi:hypothetical protein